MKIAIIGAGGVRTPMIVEAMARRQDRLGLTELALMDVDADHLELIGALMGASDHHEHKFQMTQTIEARKALSSADFVITTFRVGGMDARVIDERVPLGFGILGQETTGAGGFAMGMRSIPVLMDLVKTMQQVCPHAWLINFANPAGMLVEAVLKTTGWKRVAGICDAPSTMHRYAAALLNASPEQVYLDYFGLNHLGWVRKVVYQNQDRLPQFIEMMRAMKGLPGLPFTPEFVAQFGMFPNEYLYFYYHSKEAVQHILQKGVTRGEQIRAINQGLFGALRQCYEQNDPMGMQSVYQQYLQEREQTYMAAETGTENNILDRLGAETGAAVLDEGYAGVALDLIEALNGSRPGIIILNGPNQGAIAGLADDDVVEIPMYVSRDAVHPMAVGEIPDVCLGLIKLVKEYERLTISAATEGSYSKALQALTIHPLVADYGMARSILDEYRKRHTGFFPELK